MAFVREAMNPKGGPAGGIGGDGGVVVIVADESESTLLKFRRRRVFRAENGERGGPNKRYGAKGRNTTITVPVGTEVWDADRDELLSDLSSHGMTVVAAEAEGEVPATLDSCRQSIKVRCLRRRVSLERSAGYALN